ncbi:MAG: hypothetical protein ACRDY7_05775 [Acidimicrobiia bacterium]
MRIRFLHDRSRFGLVAVVTFGISFFPMPSARAVGFSPAGCRVEYMGDPHLTASPGVLSVKANSKIQCNKRVDDLVLTVRLYRADPDRQTAKTTADNSGRAYLLNEGTYKPCDNRAETLWFAKAWGSSYEGGKVYFSSSGGSRSNTVAVDCGVK